jgi:hypothetical protein
MVGNSIPIFSFPDSDPGSGDFLTPGLVSGIGLFRIQDLGSQIPKPYFLELSDKFSSAFQR